MDGCLAQLTVDSSVGGLSEGGRGGQRCYCSITRSAFPLVNRSSTQLCFQKREMSLVVGVLVLCEY
jgi:hypothetical protein